MKPGIHTFDLFCLHCRRPHAFITARDAWQRTDTYELLGLCHVAPPITVAEWDAGEIEIDGVLAALQWQASISDDKAIQANAKPKEAEKAALQISARIRLVQ